MLRTAATLASPSTAAVASSAAATATAAVSAARTYATKVWAVVLLFGLTICLSIGPGRLPHGVGVLLPWCVCRVKGGCNGMYSCDQAIPWPGERVTEGRCDRMILLAVRQQRKGEKNFACLQRGPAESPLLIDP